MSEQRADCLSCRHSVGVDEETARQLVEVEGYSDDGGRPVNWVSIVCVDRLRINALPIDTAWRRCAYERVPGCGRNEGD